MLSKHAVRWVLACACTAVQPWAALAQQDGGADAWPQWRGPHQNGASSAHGLPTTWSAEENVVWSTPLPSWSGATPVLWGDHVFVMTPSAPEPAAEGEAEPEPEPQGRGRGRGGRGGGGGRDPGGDALQLVCLSARDGAIRWTRTVDHGNQLFRKSNNTSSSPVTDGRHVWTVTGTGQVNAYDLEGALVWEFNLQEEYGPFGLNWGYASSPLLHDGRLVVEVLHGMNTDEPSYIVAFDAAEGGVLWRVERPTDAPRESPDAYTTPLLVEHAGQVQYVVSGADYVTGHDPATGAELWRVAGLNPRKAPNYRIVASPVQVGGVLIAPTRVRPLTAIALGEESLPDDESILWQWDERGAPDVPTPATDGTYLYMVSDGGMVTCLEPRTGEALWGPERTLEGTVSASPLVADGKLFVTDEEGRTAVLAAGPKFELLATNDLDGSYTLASPIACGDRLYIRTEKALYCIGAPAEDEE